MGRNIPSHQLRPVPFLPYWAMTSFALPFNRLGQRCNKHELTLPDLTRPCIFWHTPLQFFSNGFDEMPKVLLIGIKQGRWWGIHYGCLVRQGTEWLEIKDRIMGTATNIGHQHRLYNGQQCVSLKTCIYVEGYLTIHVHRVSLYLDPQIRDWVLFPITLVMACLRQIIMFNFLSTFNLTDSCWHTSTLYRDFASIFSKKAVKSSYTRTVR